MFRLPKALHLLRQIKTRAGFTMIELLIVISILGILAVAVLSAINPVEQISRGRDTGTQSDAEQLISAIDRHQAFQSYYPWEVEASEASPTSLAGALIEVTAAAPADTAGCTMLTKLSSGTNTCTGTNELKDTFVSRIVSGGSNNKLWIYNKGVTGASTYVCFVPQSQAYLTKAKDRCGALFPTDVEDVVSKKICGDKDAGPANVGDGLDDYYYCLP